MYFCIYKTMPGSLTRQGLSGNFIHLIFPYMKRRISLILLLLAVLAAVSAADDKAGGGKRVVAYVTSWSTVIPNPHYMTHLNYAFGHVTDSFDGVRVDNEERFRQIVALKRENPELKVLLSVGGWGSGGFSEMAADKRLRKAFAKSCRKFVDNYGIDGIDIDWEYPGSDAAGIASSPDDPANFVKLIKDLRSALGKDRLLTLASGAGAYGCLFDKFIDKVDFVNIMTYDMGRPPRHHSALHKSDNTGNMVVDTAVYRHLNAGVPPQKLTLGVPFYGRGAAPYSDFTDYKQIRPLPRCEERWDSVAMAPYIADRNGKLVIGYDNVRSMNLKCDYVDDNGLGGIMYWEYNGDKDNDELRKTIAGRMHIYNDTAGSQAQPSSSHASGR